MLSCIDGAVNVYVCGYKRVGWVILLPTEGEQTLPVENKFIYF